MISAERRASWGPIPERETVARSSVRDAVAYARELRDAWDTEQPDRPSYYLARDIEAAERDAWRAFRWRHPITTTNTNTNQGTA